MNTLTALAALIAGAWLAQKGLNMLRWARRNLTVTTHPDYVVEQGSNCAVEGVEHHV